MNLFSKELTLKTKSKPETLIFNCKKKIQHIKLKNLNQILEE